MINDLFAQLFKECGINNKIEINEKIDINDKYILYKIIADKFNVYQSILSEIFNNLHIKGIKLNREEKKKFKYFFIYDYKSNPWLNLYKDININIEEDSIEAFKDLWNKKDDNAYHQNIINSIIAKVKRIYGITSNILLENDLYLKKELSKNGYQQLTEGKFFEQYLHLLEEDIRDLSNEGKLLFPMNREGEDIETETHNLVYIKIDQSIYDIHSDYFFKYLHQLIHQSYRVLKNHQVLSIKVENVIDKNSKNIKWDIFSNLSIYAENFIHQKEHNIFYKPEKIAREKLKMHNIIISDDDEKLIKQFYKDKYKIRELISELGLNKKQSLVEYIINEAYYVQYGFSFTDCFVLRRRKNLPNHSDIINDNELLLIFHKNRLDNRKIPCPSCHSLRVSGNSYSEIGVKSWECKNPNCPDRSKSNRGKRFSLKSVKMNQYTNSTDKDNIISSEILAKWRRDIVHIDKEEDITDMLIKYHTYKYENILLFNENIHNQHNRNCMKWSYIYNEGKKQDEVFSQSWLKDILDVKVIRQNNTLDINRPLTFIHGDSRKVINEIVAKSIQSIVTSPPYYNAREYSQWSNLHLYLKDMYKIIKSSYSVLKDDGIFLFNVGDIFGNENKISTSNMGKKRIMLGAWSIYLFEQAGFELVDNIIWDKGQPQSNRHKNNGILTPHFQRPLNCYEHMFLFKKKGKEIQFNEKVDNILSFPPVIKINNKKENKKVHTAPFPNNIPYLVLKIFHKEKDDILLDMFNGSGTSAITAAQNGFKGIGIEYLEEYIDLSINNANQIDNNIEFEIIKKHKKGLS